MAVAIGQEIGSYRVEALLGQGGQAEVWRVRHRTLDSLAALKVLRVTSESLEKRLVQEGRVQASMRHPNIVSVLDVVQIEGALGLLLEFVDGPSLEQVLTDRRVAVPEALDWFRGILAAVEVAHQQGIVHRDLKPANVLLAPVSGSLLPKVADFGLARILDEAGSGTRANSAMGTLEYMAPEQVSDARSVDARADIFALGCMLYELVTTQRPFAAPNLLGYYRAIERGEYAPPCAQVPGLPAHFDAVIARCVAFERDDRFPNIAALREALQPAVSVFASIGGDGLASDVPARTPTASTPGAQTYSPGAESFGDGDIGAAGLPAAAPASAAPASASSTAPGPDSLLDAALPAERSPPAGDVGGMRLGTRATVAGAVLVVCALVALWVMSPAPSPVEPAVPSSPAAESPVAPSAPPEAVAAPPPAAPPVGAVAVPAANGAGAPAPTPSAKPTAVPAGARPVAPASTAAGAPAPAAPVAAAAVPAAPEVTPAPPPAAARASFSTDGNYSVRFEAGGAVYAPGQPLPPGDYDITADFGDGRKGAGHATVAEGASLVVRCQPGGGRCVAR